MARRPLVMGNWKLNGSKAFTKELIEGLKAELHDVTGCDVAIAPPVMYLGTAEAALSGCGCSCGGKSVIQLGAQNVDINVKGAFTGDISSEMLKDFGAKYIIIGHSERRTYHKESDEFVAKFWYSKRVNFINYGETKMARRPLVMGNWKLNGSKAFTKELIEGLKAELHDVTGCDIAIAPPVMYLGTAEAALSGCGCSCGGKSVVQLGAQNVDINVKGAFTGDISSEMLKDFGAKYIIIGHSERRTYHKESDEFIAKKFAALKEAGLVPVLCIGETEAENEAGKTEEVCARQIDAVINALGVEAFNGAVIAYEPIWAIGTGKSATPAQAQAVHAFIRGHIAAKSQAVADQVIIQYGGSVNDANAAELFTQPDIDGALVGGASLKAPAFAAIVKAAAAAKN